MWCVCKNCILIAKNKREGNKDDGKIGDLLDEELELSGLDDAKFIQHHYREVW